MRFKLTRPFYRWLQLGGKISSPIFRKMAFLTPPDRSTDWILLNYLSLTTISGPSQWSNKPGSSLAPQPTLISVGIPFSIALAGGTDHLPHSIHYGNLAKLVQKTATQGQFGCTEHLAVQVAEAALKGFEKDGMEEVHVVVEKPKALLHAKSAGVRVVRRTSSLAVGRGEGEADEQFDQILVKDLELAAIIGIHPWEREMKQKVTVNLTIDVRRWDSSTGSPDGFDCGALVNRVSEVGGALRLAFTKAEFSDGIPSMSSTRRTKLSKLWLPASLKVLSSKRP